MSMMLSSTYEAFIAAGTPPEKAKEASEEIAGCDRRLVRLEVMNALILAGVLSLVIKAFF
ncbi:integrase [Abyssogena phaseoliformis symbiont]|uniref:integrase n=1 Tax=Abyssogena phaseoliformis symbiont TaxID=596095 RepID=UPI001CEC7C61|nr:integrase [Abyssogena phaseoliformis symbiont]MBW5288928.1 hypothetical protein [Candidatus Ruthia sp. Apha_13_S6]